MSTQRFKKNGGIDAINNVDFLTIGLLSIKYIRRNPNAILVNLFYYLQNMLRSHLKSWIHQTLRLGIYWASKTGALGPLIFKWQRNVLNIVFLSKDCIRTDKPLLKINFDQRLQGIYFCRYRFVSIGLPIPKDALKKYNVIVTSYTHLFF